MPPKPEVLYEYAAKHFPGHQVTTAYEAGCCGYYAHRSFKTYGWNFLVVNPADIHRKGKERFTKTDKIDAPLVHHSDRGSQYTYKEYIALLKNNGSQISMALSAQDNAFAERINRTIKEEYLDHWRPRDFGQLKTMAAKAVKNYNNKRLHNNNDRMSPEKFITQFSFLRPQERKLMTIFDNELIN